ncbi:glycoside hydrolase family 3 C-terminal domain-containing protein [Acetobacterium bakii]|nr:glycoside hydrolase family 3 C-terminal domain-containing protein [Acetobacterium bakii]
MDKKLIRKIRRNMNLEEMTSLCSGKTAWETMNYPQYGIESVVMADGPHGLRVEELECALGMPEAKPATCFPPAVLTACSWDAALLEKIGATIAIEARAEGVDLILGPGINIKRSPLCGRNFEYFSEDPLLSGTLGKHFILGAKNQNVGTTIKHFLANNQETHRMTVNEKIDERALREIYLKGFEIAIKESQPMAVMCSYNSVNGKFLSQNSYFLTKILREEWGFEGIVISDWGAVYDRVKGVAAGLDLEMPGNGGINNEKIFDRIKEGRLKITTLNAMVERLIDFSFKAKENRRQHEEIPVINVKKHHEIAKMAAAESMVLLKNEDKTLPINQEKIKELAIIGCMAFDPRYQGSGSSKINPYRIDDAYDRIKELAEPDIQILPHQGYVHEELIEQACLGEEAIELATKSDMALMFLGLPDRYESEGYDRTNLNLPENQIELIHKICEVQPNTVVILSNGGVVDMSWADKPKAIVEMFLGGQAGGGAIADLLFGKANFCGKLTETIPMKLEDTPSYINFPGIQDEVIYGESIFVGYRYYDYTKKEVRYPFGFGLSYTSFHYEGLENQDLCFDTNNSFEVKCRVTNTGDRDGKEILQLYTGKKNTKITRPLRELRHFKKVFIPAGKSVEVSFEISQEDFNYYNPSTQKWEHEGGIHEIYIGSSSQDLPVVFEVSLPDNTWSPLTQYSYLSDFERSARGRVIIKILLSGFEEAMGQNLDANDAFFMAMLKGSPLRKLVEFSNGIFSEESIEKILYLVNKNASLEGLTFEDLIAVKEKKKGWINSFFSRNDDQTIGINSKVRDIVNNEDAMKILRNYFEADAFDSEYLQIAIRMGVCFDKAQKLLPDDFFSDEMLALIDLDFKNLAKKK